MKDTIPSPPCPECLYVGEYKGEHVFLCSKLNSNGKTKRPLQGGFTFAPNKSPLHDELMDLELQFSCFFTNGYLNDYYFAMQKLLQ